MCVSDKTLVGRIGSFLHKATAIPRISGSGRLCLLYKSKCVQNVDVSQSPIFDVTKAYDYPMPMPQVANFYLVDYLGAGADGKAVLLYSKTKKQESVCVGKFFKEKDHAQAEVDILLKVYDDKGVRLTTLNNKHVVLMPYRLILKDDEFSDAATQQKILDHVGEIAKKGYIHNDLERKHVAWTDNKKNQICFIDWSRWLPFKSNNNISTTGTLTDDINDGNVPIAKAKESLRIG